MEKVLIAMNETTFSEGAFSFARQLAMEQPSLLTGVFLPDMMNGKVLKQSEEAVYLYEPFIEQQRVMTEANLTQFRDRCAKSGLAFRVHTGFLEAMLPALRHESRFADLLILSSEKFYGDPQGHAPSALLETVLYTAACPVVVVPESFAFPKRNTVLFDGSASSAYAIKQFAYLFPAWCTKPTTLVWMNEEEILPQEEEEIREWMHRHFQNISFEKMHPHRRNGWASWIQEQKEALIIGGAFDRSPFFQWIGKSLLAEVIAIRKFPVFVAHRNRK